jgi:PTH1 family peptidyl-tRNA hydrolase
MWLIVGLGNPGRRYSETRHNIGFKVLDLFAEKYNVKFIKTKIAKKTSIFIDGEELLLLKPLLYMNMSGVVVKEVLQELPIRVSNIVVVHDDLDMMVGKLRIRRNGSSGGHRGVESIIQSIGTKDFIRVKIGIGRSKDLPPEEYVLSKFGFEDKEIIREALKRAIEAILTIVTEGVGSAMNKFN